MTRLGNRHQPLGGGPRGRRTAAALGLCAALAAGACGKKGPPLPPLVLLPAAVGEFTARRVGSQVFFQFRVPTGNADGSRPADLRQVEIYGHTGRLAGAADYLKAGTLVGTVMIRQPATSEQGAPAAPATEPGVDQGAVATCSETLTPEALTLPAATRAAPAPPAPSPPQAATAGSKAGGPPVATTVSGTTVETAVPPPPPPGRFYVAVGISRRGRRGALSPAVGIPIVPPPASPTAVRAAYGPDRVSIEWTPGSQPPAASAADRSTAIDAAATPAQKAFNVYEVGGTAGAAASDAGAEPRASAPLNAAPLAETSFADERIEFGKTRCYSVRAVVTISDLHLESEPSQSVCVTPVDTFPPAAPQSLAAVSSARGISLIWEANTEKDLGGYLVLRGEAPGDRLAVLTPVPVHETTYHDAAARRGVTYVYAVVAVDTATPANVSAQSNRVEETIR